MTGRGRRSHAALLKVLKEKAKDGSLIQKMKEMDVEIIVSKRVPEGQALCIFNKNIQGSDEKKAEIFKEREERDKKANKENFDKSLSNTIVNLSLLEVASTVASAARYSYAELLEEEKGGVTAAKDALQSALDLSEKNQEEMLQTWEGKLEELHSFLRELEKRTIPAEKRVAEPSKLARARAGPSSGEDGGSEGGQSGEGKSGVNESGENDSDRNSGENAVPSWLERLAEIWWN